MLESIPIALISSYASAAANWRRSSMTHNTPTGTREANSDAVVPIATVEAFFSPEECDRAIALANLAPELKGTVSAKAQVSQVRNSQVKFVLPDRQSAWIYQKLEAAITDMNKAYRYHLTGIEPIQIARYPEGCYYGWHIDAGPGANSARKLSLSVQLSDPGDYTGGSLEFMDTPTRENTGRGTLIVFPSFMTHRVSAVTSGVRQSLVAWVTGSDRAPPEGAQGPGV
jgi:PKHD-type hydroxylase